MAEHYFISPNQNPDTNTESKKPQSIILRIHPFTRLQPNCETFLFTLKREDHPIPICSVHHCPLGLSVQ